jgi:hypothetical protein
MPVEITNKKTGDKTIMETEKADKVRKSNIAHLFYFKDIMEPKTPPEVTALKKGKPEAEKPKTDIVN